MIASQVAWINCNGNDIIVVCSNMQQHCSNIERICDGQWLKAIIIAFLTYRLCCEGAFLTHPCKNAIIVEFLKLMNIIWDDECLYDMLELL